MNSKFSYNIEDNVVCIEDLMGLVSVTNDMENVLDYIETIEGINIKEYCVIYKDSYGIWDSIVFNGDRISFNILDCQSKEKVLMRINYGKK